MAVRDQLSYKSGFAQRAVYELKYICPCSVVKHVNHNDIDI